MTRTQLVGLLGLDALNEAVGTPAQTREAALAAICLNELVPRSETARLVWRATMEVLQNRLAKAGRKGPAGWARRWRGLRPAGRAAQSDRLPVVEIAQLFGVSRSTLFRLRDIEPDARLVRAVKLQVDLRRKIAAAPDGCFVPGETARLGL